MMCRSKTREGHVEVGEELDVDQNSSTVDKTSSRAPAVVPTPRSQTDPAQDRVRINVSGLIFEVPVKALDRHPDTGLRGASSCTGPAPGNSARQPGEARTLLGRTPPRVLLRPTSSEFRRHYRVPR